MMEVFFEQVIGCWVIITLKLYYLETIKNRKKKLFFWCTEANLIIIWPEFYYKAENTQNKIRAHLLPKIHIWITST